MRVRVIFVFFLTLLSLIVLKLFYWQVVSADGLARTAALQRSAVTTIPAQRGEILASDGKILVGNEQTSLLFASTYDLQKKPDEVALLLAPILWQAQKEDLSTIALNKGQSIELLTLDQLKFQIASKLKEKSYYIPLQHRLAKRFVDQIVALKVYGLEFDPEPRRLYPEGALASTTLGFVGSGNDGGAQGYFGLEGFYNSELSGKSGVEKLERDATGQPILIGSFDLNPPQDGRSLVTTIDRYIQFVLEKHLEEGIEKYGAKKATAMVLDPKTGNILASVTLPAFDPRKYDLFDSGLYKDGAVSDTYEPGSTFKTVTMAAALDLGLVTPTTICPVCDHAFSVQGHEIQTWNNEYYTPGTETTTTILEHSDNVGAAWVATKIGKDKYFSYTKAFGLGSKTGVDIEGEEAGVFYPSANLQPIDLATMSFGQGFSLTALKMVQIAATFGNDGVMMKPRFVQKIIDGGRQIDIAPTKVGQIIKPQTAHTLSAMLVDAVEKGEAKRIIPHGMRIAGKTGTAQVPIEGHYDPHKTTASFVGYGPVENPKFAMIIKYDQPSSSIYAALTAEPTFFDIAKDLYAYFGLTTTP